MSTKGKIAKFIRDIPLGGLFRTLVLPLINIGGFWGKLIGWLSPKAVDQIEEVIDEKLEEVETSEAVNEGIDHAVETRDQRSGEDILDPSHSGAPSQHGGVQTRPSRRN